jgi:hypothetical protein
MPAGVVQVSGEAKELVSTTKVWDWRKRATDIYRRLEA